MAERSVNKTILVGRLGGDAETRHTQNGTPVSRVSLAMNRQWRDREEQIHEDTDWISVVLWNSENLAEFLTRGKQVYVEGRLQTRSYEDKNGIKRYVTEVVAQNVVLLSGGGGNGTGNGSQEKCGNRRTERTSNRTSPRPQPEPDMPEMIDDSVPF